MKNIIGKLCVLPLRKDVRSMYLNTVMKIGDNLTKDSSLSDRAYVGLQVVLIGMGVVFSVLVLLIGILQLFKLFANKQPEVNVKKEPTIVSAPTPAPAPTVQAPSKPTSEEELVVAIATAAIAAQRGESECNFNIISIKKIV